MEVTVVISTNLPFKVDFSDTKFSQFDTNQLDNNQGGSYTYKPLSASTALLTLTKTVPPNSSSRASQVLLTFTQPGVASFVTTNGDGTVQTGAVNLATAPATAPASIAGKTVTHTSKDGTGTITFAASGNKYTQTGNDTSGTYSYSVYSPVAGVITTTRTNGTSYVEVEFTTAATGFFISTDIEKDGSSSVSSGTFTIQ